MDEELGIKLQKGLLETFRMLNETTVKGQGNIYRMWSSMNNIQVMIKYLEEDANIDSDGEDETKEE